MAYGPREVVEGPTRRPLPYGIFSVVPFAEAATERWENGVAWEAFGCNPTEVVVGDCQNPEGFPKQFPSAGPGQGGANAFTVYASAKCSPVGGDMSKQSDRARETLLAREEQGVEKRFWQNLAQDRSATTLTPTTPLLGVAELEEWIGDTYGSLGVLHVTRKAATVLVKQAKLRPNGKQMFTSLGTPVVVGSGYQGDTQGPGVGEPEGSWTYASPSSPTSQFIAITPGMFGYRSEIFTGTDDPSDYFDHTRNNLYGIAERNYLVGYETCGAAFIEIDLGAS